MLPHVAVTSFNSYQLMTKLVSRAPADTPSSLSTPRLFKNKFSTSCHFFVSISERITRRDNS